MKESINFYYNFSVGEVEKYGSVYTFKIRKDIFYFVPLKRVDAELKDLMEVYRELKNKRVNIHDIVLNKFGSIVTNVYNQNYILLKPKEDIYIEYDLTELMKFNNSLSLTPAKSKLYRNSWAKLWSDKIDYFEYQIRELGKDKNVILDSFSYYVGLAENAISYVNSTSASYNGINDKIVLSHRRINYPNYSLNFLNPISFIFDLEVRDIASFIKSAFIAGEDALNYLRLALRLNQFSIYSLQMLYARLIYPTFYFDVYEKVMNDEASQDDLIPIIEKAQDYELFLKQAYLEICKYAPIERVEWLLKDS